MYLQVDESDHSNCPASHKIDSESLLCPYGQHFTSQLSIYFNRLDIPQKHPHPNCTVAKFVLKTSIKYVILNYTNTFYPLLVRDMTPMSLWNSSVRITILRGLLFNGPLFNESLTIKYLKPRFTNKLTNARQIRLIFQNWPS